MLVYKHLLLSRYSETIYIYTMDFKAFTMFSLISDLTGHKSIMFGEILHRMYPTMVSPSVMWPDPISHS